MNRSPLFESAPWTVKVAVIIPTLNASDSWSQFHNALESQGIPANQILVLDSESTDNTITLAREAGFVAISIRRTDFNHGGTRQWAIRFFPDAEIVVYLTQDAILAHPAAIRELVAVFDDHQVGAAYGRQLPRHNAGPIEAHGRLFNYPEISQVRTLGCRAHLGLKTVFISNSFAAYRRNALESVGGFPANVIFGEDTIVAGRLLLEGWKVVYESRAQVYHSHQYTIWKEFQRYFDIGVLHARESWLLKEFGGTGREGKRFVLSELRHLWPRYVFSIPSALFRTVAKFAGYQLGLKETKLSLRVKRMLSMHSRFWSTD